MNLLVVFKTSEGAKGLQWLETEEDGKRCDQRGTVSSRASQAMEGLYILLWEKGGYWRILSRGVT